MTASNDVVELLRRDGIAAIQRLNETAGRQARTDAEAYAVVYEGQRAAMVFDIVASRRRRYVIRVVPLVARFSDTTLSDSLEVLAAASPATAGA